MAAQIGDKVLLKISNGATPAVFELIGGLRNTSFSLSNQTVDATHTASGAWRAILGAAGQRSMSFSGSGIFTDSPAERRMRAQAFANGISRYRLEFGNGDLVTGDFQVTRYDRSGAYGSEELYTLSLASAGPVEYVAANS